MTTYATKDALRVAAERMIERYSERNSIYGQSAARVIRSAIRYDLQSAPEIGTIVHYPELGRTGPVVGYELNSVGQLLVIFDKNSCAYPYELKVIPERFDAGIYPNDDGHYGDSTDE